MKIMPSDTEADLSKIEHELRTIVSSEGGIVKSIEHVPVGFGIISLVINYSIDEDKGTDDMENLFTSKVPGVESAQTTMTSRALG